MSEQERCPRCKRRREQSERYPLIPPCTDPFHSKPEQGSEPEIVIGPDKYHEQILVAADRVHEAYAAFLEGRDLGRLPDWGAEVTPAPPASELVRLCVETHHLIDPGNYEGPVHCLAHPEGHACVTALYARVTETTVTAAERERLS